MYNKKGLSTIVATVLIVLLSLGAIAIVWSFVEQYINSAGGAMGVNQQCTINIEVKPTSCSYNSATNATTMNVQVVKNVGDKIKKITASLEYMDNTRVSNDTVIIPSTGSTSQATFAAGTKKPLRVRAIAKIQDPSNSANYADCPESISLDCVAA